MIAANGSTTNSTTPSWLKVDGDAIPAELKQFTQWVCWRALPNKTGGKPRKVPVDPVNRCSAKSNDPTTWNQFERCWHAYLNDPQRYAGIGFEFSANDEYAGIDLDDCRNPKTGELHQAAQQFLAKVKSYCEVSPSGTGVKLIVRGKLPEQSKHKAIVDGIEVEVYDRDRYFALTGCLIDDEHREIVEGQAGLDELVAQIQVARAASNGAAHKAAGRQLPLDEPLAESDCPPDERFRRAVKRAISIRIPQQENDGSRRLLKVAIIAVELDLSDQEAVRLVREVHRLAPFPVEWSDGEIERRLRDAEKKTHRGKCLQSYYRVTGATEGAATVTSATDSNDRPKIIITAEEHLMTEAAVAVLARADDVFQRGGVLVHVVRDDALPSFLNRPKDAPRIAALPIPRLREVLSREATWWKPSRDGGLTPCRVDAETVKQVDARAFWPGVRPLEGIIESPILRPDGSIVTEPGYDSPTGLLYVPNVAVPVIKAEPTKADAHVAAKDLLDLEPIPEPMNT